MDFAEYANRYECIEFAREGGVLEMRMHTRALIATSDLLV